MNKKEKRKKVHTGNLKNKGVTLVVLVITIIILLILSGVTIATLTGNKGILNYAKKAANNYTDAQEKELAELDKLDDVISNLEKDESNEDNSNSNEEDITISKEDYNKLKDTITELSKTVENLKGQITTINQNITEMNTWKIIDTNLTLPTTNWTKNSVTIPELKEASKVALYDERYNTWIYINRVNGSDQVFYTNGIPDVYNFASYVQIYFDTGRIDFSPSRLGTNVLNDNPPNYIPKITKVAYTK